MLSFLLRCRKLPGRRFVGYMIQEPGRAKRDVPSFIQSLDVEDGEQR